MTSRERFLKLIGGEAVDRVPVTLFIQHQGHFMAQVYPDINPHDSEKLDLKVIEIQRQLGVDVFVRILFDWDDPDGMPRSCLDVKKQTENWQVKTKEKTNGNLLTQKSTITTPEGVLTQEFTVNEICKGTFVHACTKKPIESFKDLEIAMKYEPKMGDMFPLKVKERVNTVKQALGEDGIVGVWTPNGPYNTASHLVRTDELYMLHLANPEFYEKLIRFSIERTRSYTEAIAKSGADVLIVGANVPGGFLGKRCYDEYILPFEREYIDICQKTGKPALYHNCGEIMKLIESYRMLGVRMVEPFSPPPLGDADLAEAKRRACGSYVITGGVDQVNVLKAGSKEKVRKITEDTIRVGKPGGSFILQSADFLEYGTPLENLETFVKTGLENAWY